MGSGGEGSDLEDGFQIDALGGPRVGVGPVSFPDSLGDVRTLNCGGVALGPGYRALRRVRSTSMPLDPDTGP